MMKTMGPEKLSLFIENDWNILESVFYGLHCPPIEAYKNMSPQEVAKAESIRKNMYRFIVPLISMAKNIAAKFPAEAIEKKVTADWFLEKGEQHFPELIQVINKYGDKGRVWLEKQAEQIREFLIGRIIFHPQKLRFVKIEELKAELVKALTKTGMESKGS
jgi:hypothetical protein